VAVLAVVLPTVASPAPPEPSNDLEALTRALVRLRKIEADHEATAKFLARHAKLYDLEVCGRVHAKVFAHEAETRRIREVVRADPLGGLTLLDVAVTGEPPRAELGDVAKHLDAIEEILDEAGHHLDRALRKLPPRPEPPP
jgi:hypothetical protein